MSAGRTVFSAAEVSVGDVVAYPALKRERGRRHYAPCRDLRDWLRVTRVEGRQIWGTRVHPEGWEEDIEFSVFPLQIEENGVVVADD